MKYYEDSDVDAEIFSFAKYEVTKEEVIEQGKRWDPQPFHIDEQAAESSIFGGLVASSAHLFSIAVWFGSKFPEEWAAVSALGFDQLKLHIPVRPGDVLSYRAKCVGKRPSKSRPDCGIVEYRGEILNQKGEVVFSFISAALHSMRDPEKS
jgi:acyl dehydratase